MDAPKQPNKHKSTALLLVLGGLGLLLLGVAYQFGTPKIYQATARVEFSGQSPASPTAGGSRVASLLPEYQYLNSDEVLDQVVTNLHLREVWGARRSPESPLTAEAARLRLRHKARIELLPFMKVIEITVVSDDRNETAAIANEMARVYWEHRQAQKQSLSAGQFTVMTDRLKPLWDEASAKALAAQERLAAVTEDIKRARAASGDTLYEPAALEQLQAQRIKLETDYVEARNMQIQLKAFTPAQLRDVLPTLATNVLLDKSLEALLHAQTELADAQTTKGANSPEAARAIAAVGKIGSRVDQVISGIMAARETDVAVRKAALDALNEKLSHARTALDRSLTTSNETYQAALAELQRLNQERDLITNRISLKAMVEPLTLSAEVVDAAQTPAKPVSPDENITRSAVVIGGLAFLAGLALMFFTRRTQPPSAPARTTSQFPAPRRN